METFKNILYTTRMDNLIFSLNATVPIFLLMVFGYLLKKIGIFNDDFINTLNRFVFRIALPALLFKDLATQDFTTTWNTKFVLFCFFVTFICILCAYVISIFVTEKKERGEFTQVAYRSSAAILGIAFITNIYGNAGMAPLMIIGTVPLYNIFAVIVLSVTAQDTFDKNTLKKTCKGILTNPILLGIAFGLVYSLLQGPYPPILDKTVTNIANLATPLGLMAMGGAFEFQSASHKLKPAILATFLKLVGFAAIFLPVAIWFGFRQSELIAILVMLASSSTVSCYIMARNMGHEGILTSVVVMLTTLLSAFSLTFWLWLLKTLTLI